MNRHADFSPQGPWTDPRAWSFRWRLTSPRSCGLKSAIRVRFMGGERVHLARSQSEHAFSGITPPDAASLGISLGDLLCGR